MSASASARPARYVLDSFALIAHFEDEEGSERVRALLTDAEAQRVELFVSIINYGEVVYITERDKGLTAAQKVIAAVDQLPLEVIEADRKLTFAAAHIKAHHSISYADAFAVALAQSKDAILLTGDPEFRKVEQQATIEWLYV